ncbi:HAMP domain-containing sensor histidine kinase [Paenibacillus sp. BIHB 4019]|nr:HAMP domain-containing sensor histidine kinase [Paenibacillus sp. BIHB 4019]
MKNKLWAYLFGKKSIRVQMLWAFIFSLILATLFSTIYSMQRPQSGFIYKFLPLGIFVLSFWFSFILMTRRTIRYFKTITDGLKAMSFGNLNYRIPLSSQDELGHVAQNINDMAEQLQSKLERERQLEKSKMELITSVSHDLRTPLTSIIGYLDLLKTHSFQDVQEQERYIDNAYNKTQQLKKLIDDLFEYTRLSDPDVHLSFQEIDFNRLLAQLVTEFEPVAQEQNIIIKKALPAVPVIALMDTGKMVRAIDNLLMNALKFSVKPGEITVQLFVQEGRITLSIENMGQPITKEQEEQLFERFYKMQPSRNHAQMPAGFGLGLSIAKHIVELHNGRIWLNHDQGHYAFCAEFKHPQQQL